MGLMQQAVQTYDNFAHLAGTPQPNHPTLTPVSHMVQRAQVEITLHSDGSFASAAAVDEKTIIPATEKSANRTSGPTDAHPLSDQIGYLTPLNPTKYNAYLEGLRRWAASEYAHPKLRPILTYVEGGGIVEDLVRADLIAREADGSLSEKVLKNMVRWRVLGLGEPTACWEDQTLLTAFDQFYRSGSAGEDKTLCIISGQQDVPAKSNPKGVLASVYGAKLISANDDRGFTYRGRFTEPGQAAGIGYTASQKAHHALQWIVADQAVYVGGRAFVCWNPKGLAVISPVSPFGALKDKPPLRTPTDYRQQLRETMDGFRQTLPDDEDVVIAALEAATTGRLSVTYYSEYKAADFRRRLEHWYTTCAWNFGKFGMQSPSIRQIATMAFGTERRGERGVRVELDGRVLREQMQKLLPCVIAAAPIPQDIVRALRQRATMQRLYETGNRIQLLSIACAVIQKNENERHKEAYSMELDPKKKDRSYQCGRLLAVFEKIERDTYFADETREPNAVKMQSVFSERPLYATRILGERIRPYYQRLKPSSRVYYEKLIMEILGEIGEDGVERRLGDTYILGYYLQKAALYQSNKKTEEEHSDEYTAAQD